MVFVEIQWVMFGSSSPQAGGFSSRPADGDWNRLLVWLSQVRFGRCDYFIVIYVQRHVSINSDLHQALIWQTKGIGLPARLLHYQNEILSTNKIQGMNGNITAVIFFTQPLAPTLQLRPSSLPFPVLQPQGRSVLPGPHPGHHGVLWMQLTWSSVLGGTHFCCLARCQLGWSLSSQIHWLVSSSSF